MKRNIIPALFISLALHALLAVALAFYLNDASAPDELAQLDLTSVELSFAETVEETAAAVASAPAKPSDAPPPVEAPPPPLGDAESLRVEKDELSVSDAVRTPRPLEAILPSPTEPIEKVTVEPQREVVRQEARDEKAEVERREREVVRQEARDMNAAAPAPPQQASAPRQARVDAPAKPRRAIKPDYPRESRLRGEQGNVTLEIDVAADGSVSAARILKSPGYPLLDAAALKAARAARFTPARSSGKPVASTARLTLTFKLR